jgi:hypothetical protein
MAGLVAFFRAPAATDDRASASKAWLIACALAAALAVIVALIWPDRPDTLHAEFRLLVAAVATHQLVRHIPGAERWRTLMLPVASVGVCSGIWCDRVGARQAFSALESDSLGGGHELASMHRAAIHVGPSSSRQAASGLWSVHRGGLGRHFDKPVAWRLWHHGLDLLVARHFVAKSPPSGIRQPHWYGRSSLRGHCGRGSIVARGSLATSQGLARNRTGGKRG